MKTTAHTKKPINTSQQVSGIIPPEIIPLGDSAVMLLWPDIICPLQHQNIIATEQFIRQQLTSYLIDSVASYASLALYYDVDQVSYQDLAKAIKDTLKRFKENVISQTRSQAIDSSADDNKLIEIPVYYGEEYALDLAEIAQQKKLTTEEVIELHSGTRYRAYALGFTPGFCYLASLNNQIQLPRRNSPRAKVPAGAVAIAEQQTAVYPSESPGGWHIIGQTPLPMLQQGDGQLTPRINIGDEVQFIAIDKDTFDSLQAKTQGCS